VRLRVKNRHVVVELLPDHIDVVVRDGVIRTHMHRLPFTPEPDPFEWAKAVRRSAASLRAIVDGLGLEGLSTIVLYRSPTQSIDLAGCAVRHPSEAINAAVLSCCDSLSYSSLSAVCEGSVIGRDATGDARQTHVVVAAEREDIAEAIVAMVTDAGLKVASITPLEAAVGGAVLSRALADKRPQQGRLHIGEHASFFVVTSEGRVIFNRRIGLGLDAVVRSLTRPIRRAGQDGQLQLSYGDARRILAKHGIPGRDDIVDVALQLRGGEVIPSLQPVLQRYIVELRQSLRFGVMDEDRGKLRIELTGPGAALPRLAELISEELDVETVADAAYAAYDWEQPGSDGSESFDALCQRRLIRQINVLPRSLATKRRTGRFRQWLWTGAAVAVAVIAVDGFRFHGQLAAAREKVEAANLADFEALKATEDRLMAAVVSMNSLESTIRTELDASVNFRACLQELTEVTPDTIRFTNISFDRREGRTFGRIGGYAFETDEAVGERALAIETFVDALRRSPLFEEAVLENVRVGAVGGLRGQRFETTVVVMPIISNFTPGGNDIAAAGGGK
jgi:hypothetical protein